MLHPDTPGAYLQRSDSTGTPIVALRTDVPGFIGIAERGPLDVPVAVESFRQFQAVFGGFIGGGYLAYSLRAFFENGGRRARVLRVASRDAAGGAASAFLDIADETGNTGWTVSAASPGSWGNALTISILPKARAQTTIDFDRSTPQRSGVVSTSGFAPLSLVRISQAGIAPIVRIVTRIDASQRLLYWIEPNPGSRRPFERALTGLDPNLPATIESIDYDLMVWSSGRLATIYRELSLVPQHARYAPIVLALPDYTNNAIPDAPPLVTITATALELSAVPVPLAAVADERMALTGGKDGLATLTADDFIGDPLQAAEIDGEIELRGLAALANISEISMLAAPDILIQPIVPPLTLPAPTADPCSLCPQAEPQATPVGVVLPEQPPIFSDDDIFAVQAAMIDQAESRRDRVVLLDPPFDAAQGDYTGISPTLAWRDRFDSAFGALYFPWIAAPDPLQVAPVRLLPPSGHVAGQIAASDLARGVHWAPANTDLSWAQYASVDVNSPTHGVLNTAGVNVVRAECGRPLRIRGARTTSSDPTFRFLNVRRLVCMIRVALDVATQWVVFEPNTPATRNALAAALGQFLRQLWEHGALNGDTPADAYAVLCDETNNPAEQRANGELHADIAISPSVPMEFIILRLGRSQDSLEIEERGALAAGLAS